ncbi:MAG: hypothetical protein M1824_002369 [Vezdaea acicularis]|nr:MAG: hypothetical protein M1824_002369 [Vezdaea acicularis]
MADDTRKGPSSGNPQKLPPPNMKPQITEYIKRPENANLLAGGTENTAGGKTPDIPSLGEIAKSIKIEEFKEVHQKPCVRESLLTGMGSGFAVGGIRAVLGASIPRASNWAVGTFCFMSFGAYQYCQYRRYVEKQGMARAVEVVELKRAAKQREKREEERKAKEEEARREEERIKTRRWYKFW